MNATPGFAASLVSWHGRHGRHDLPWQGTEDPYRVWLSEIMLQQTQVATVIPYYRRFLADFPDLAALATAPEQSVLAAWSGLGYYARARNLQRCARLLITEHGGVFPRDPEILARLPGIGPSTANAIAVFCFGARAAILDGNVKRVLCRCFGIEGYPGRPKVERLLWRLAADLLPARDVAAYIQAQMDLGATLCTRSKPSCGVCPVGELCIARRAGRVAELPQARPKKTLPEKEARVLVLLDSGRVLLLTRPPTGIWGALMSLPEVPDGAAPADYAAEILGCRGERFSELPSLVHTFTHFRLTLRPLLAEVRSLPRAAESAGREWLSHHELEGAALPAPIRRLLAAVLPAAEDVG